MKKRLKANTLEILIFIVVVLGLIGSCTLFNQVAGTLIYILLIMAICLI